MMVLANIHAVWTFLAGVALLTFILIKRSSRYFRKPTRKRNEGPIDLQNRPQSKWDGSQQDAMAHVERQKVEMHEMARDINGQLTTKIIVLEKLIAESGQQIKRMEELLREIDRLEQATLSETSVELE